MEIIKIKEKVFYRVIEFTSRLIKYELAHEDYKLIALNQKEANTETEKKVKRLADTFLFLLNQTSQILDFEMISTAYYLLTNKKISTTNLDNILESFYLFKDETAHVQAANILIIINGLNFTRKLEFSILISNYILIKENYFPVIFHESDKKYLKSLIKDHNCKDLIEFIYMHEYQTRHGIGSVEKSKIKLTLDELIELILQNKEELMEKFKIKSLFVYGGFVKNKIHKTSDIDLLVYMEGSLISYQKHDYISQAQRFLTGILDSKLDVLDFSYSLKYAEIKEMNNSIKIF